MMYPMAPASLANYTAYATLYCAEDGCVGGRGGIVSATTIDSEQRVSRLQGAYERLATKADLKDLELKLTLRLLTVGIATGIIIAADRLAG